MAEFCTCGAQLVPGARFCHKCGRPVGETPELAEPETPPPGPATPPWAPPPPAAEIGFHNRTAVRIGLLVAALALALSSIPVSPLLPLAVMLGAGALSVYLYNRRTGQSLSVRAGLRLGWMTGLFGFLISMVLMTIALALISSQGEAFGRALREQSGLSEEMIERVLEILGSPAELLLSLALGFLTFSLAAAAGGALGARVFGKH